MRLPVSTSSYRLPDALGYLLHRNAKIMGALAEEAFRREFDLSFVQFVCLMLLRDGLAGTPGELARFIGHNSGAATRLVDQMEARGFVTRTRCLEDRRSIRLRLTPKGDHAIRRTLPLLLELWGTILRDFEDQEYADLIRLLKKLLTALQDASNVAGQPAMGPRVPPTDIGNSSSAHDPIAG